ncbi:MAG: hypothetical protein CO095_02510 [Armatimonadetes bacterium CG_4_9_14_3_um_filter_58_7]|nr:MAG: hypothetical protein CO095_02510 [Armatimonadetes bacterium CG_4_9_14_3_um_filter_58_7]
MSYRLIRRTQERLSHERRPELKSPEGRDHFAVSFPNTYFVGMSNLGLHAVYHHVNAHPFAVCERVFLPDAADLDELNSNNTPLFSLESQKLIRDFHMVGFSLSFEEDYIRVLRILQLSHIPLHVADREDLHPIVIAGGPCASYNPEPMTEFIDVFAIGDGEPLIPAILETLHPLYYPSGGNPRATRLELLESLSKIEGLYVPSVTGYGHPVRRQSVEDINAHPADTQVFTPDTEFANVHLVEIARGCFRRCRFCAIPYSTRPPKMATSERVLEVARLHRCATDRVGLVGASVSDYRDITRLVTQLADEGFGVQLPSLRSDRLSEEFLDAIWGGGQRSITIAPEAATDRLRSVVSKSIPNEQIIESVARAAHRGFRHIKLYFMIGLPGESQEDIDAFGPFIGAILKEARNVDRIAVTVNPFIPKPWTPMQWAGMDRPGSLQKKSSAIRDMFSGEKRVEVRVTGVRWGQVQTMLSIGEASIGRVIGRAFELGGFFRYWRQAANDCGIDWDTVIHGGRPADFQFPWDHINTGTSKARLRLDLEKCELTR